MNEFERTLQYLRSKLPEYLAQRGINPQAKFNCLNPAHKENLPTMSYREQDQTVQCFNCHVSYDIFKLIGIDYNLQSFEEQFAKAHEIFIGAMPYNLQDQLYEYLRQRNSNVRPGFAAANDYRAEQTPGGASVVYTREFQPAQPGAFKMSNTFMPQERRQVQDTRLGAGTGAATTQSPFGFGGGGQGFGQNPFSNFASQNNRAPASFAPQGTAFGTPAEGSTDYSEYYKQCQLQLDRTDYFRQRGISDEVIRRFRLGYDDHCEAGFDQSGGKILWRAAIIPYSDHAYIARNTDRNAPPAERFKHRGGGDFFNKQVLDKPGTVFVTEGEFDALSLETLGYSAVSLGGSGNVRYLLEYLKTRGNDLQLYICMDNDEAGEEAAKQLASGLYALHIPYHRVNLSFPYKDPNEALCADRDAFKERLDNLKELLSFKLLPPELPKGEHSFITSPEELNALKLSPAFYSLGGSAQLLRNLMADILNSRLCHVVYAAGRSQWLYLCSQLKLPSGQNQLPESLQALNPRLLPLDGSDPIKTIRTAVNALRLQGEGEFVTVVDLCAYTPEQSVAYALELSRLAEVLGMPFVALCNVKSAPLVEAVALQHLDVSAADEHFVLSGFDGSGRSLNFKKFRGV